MGELSGPGRGKVAPHNLDAEQVLLGAILLDNTAFDPVGDFLEPEHFFEKFNRTLFECMRTAIRVGKLVAVDTVKSLLSLPGNYPVGDSSLDLYLHKIASNGCSPANAGDYGMQIRDLAVRRDLITIAEDITKEAYTAPADATARSQIEGIEQRLFSLAEHHVQNTGFIPFSETLTRTVKAAGDAYQRGGGLSGIPTGLHDLDHKMGGLTGTDFIIIAGRPGMGKTALATNIAYNVARTWTGKTLPDGLAETITGGRVGFFSLEMSAEQLGIRIVSDQASLDSSKIRRGQFNEQQFGLIKTVERERNTIPLYIDETGGLTVAQICSRARRLKRQYGLDLLVIDYLQLIAGGKNRRDNRTQELTEITTNLKALAKELRVPIIALSQLSRAVEGRDDKRPQLSDLRESGSIEQDADIVMFVFREAYYVELKEPAAGSDEHLKWQDQMTKLDGKADIIIAKQRHGWTGAIPVHFDRTLTRFSTLANANALPDMDGPPGPMNDPRADIEGIPF